MQTTLLGGITVAVVTAAVGLTAMNGFTAYQKAAQSPQPPYATINNVAEFREGGAKRGHPEGRVELVVFNDYLCGACKKFDEVVTDALKEFGDSLSITYRQLPRRFDSTAVTLARAAICASRLGHFMPFNAHVFSRTSLSADSLRQYARESGIHDRETFERCAGSVEAVVALRQDSLLAARLGTRGTPTILIGNEEYRGIPVGFRQILRRHLNVAYGLAKIGD